MSSRIEVLLSAWGKWSIAGERRALGYSPVSPMFRDARPGRGYDSAPPPGIGSGELIIIDQAVNGLPKLLKLIVIETYIIGGSHREISTRIGCSHMALGKYLSSAYTRLENSLHEGLTAG